MCMYINISVFNKYYNYYDYLQLYNFNTVFEKLPPSSIIGLL